MRHVVTLGLVVLAFVYGMILDEIGVSSAGGFLLSSALFVAFGSVVLYLVARWERRW